MNLKDKKCEKLNKSRVIRELPGGQVVRIQCFHVHGPGSILGWRTEIPQATWHGMHVCVCLNVYTHI